MPNASHIDTRVATAADLPAIGGALGRAFHDDPVWNWALRRDDITAAAGTIMRLFALAHLDDDLVYVTTDEHGTVRGAAVWAPPNHWRLPLSLYVRHLPTIVPALGLRNLPRIATMGRIEKVHPRDEHYYLALVGVEPSFQGRGAGRALLDPVIERADDEGLPCFLESSKPENVPYYRSFGFEVSGQIDLPKGPSLWQMRREPR